MDACIPAINEGNGIVLAGVFASLIAVVGWLVQSTVGGLIWFYQRRAAEYERLIGLQAEIASNIKFEAKYADPVAIQQIVAKMRERAVAGEDIPPYTVIFRENIVFDRIKPDITSLPESVIGVVVDYYLKSGGLDATLLDQRSEPYCALSIDRAAGVWGSVGQLAKEAVEAGENALSAIETRIARYKNNQKISLMATALGGVALALLTVWVVCWLASLSWCPAQLSGRDNRVSHWISYDPGFIF